jgi:hypothetical protein
MRNLDIITSLGVFPGVASVARTYTTTVGDQAVPIVAAQAGKRIRVWSWAVSISINGSNCFIKDSSGVQKTELLLRTTGGNAPNYYTRSAYPGIMLFDTAVGASLQLNCTTAGATNSVQIVYSYT